MMKKIQLLTIALTCSLLLFTGSARAEAIFGEFQRLPDQIERGFSIGFDFGMLFLTGTKRSVVNPGFQLAFTTGYDINDYISIDGIYTLGINEASPLDPVLDGGVNTFFFHLAGKGQLPLGRFYPFVAVGPGIHHSRPKFLPPNNNKLSILIAGGIEYYTFLRHYSLILKGTYIYSQLPIDAMTISAGLKYTF